MRRLENKIKYILITAFVAAFAFSNISFAQVRDIDAGEVIELLNAERQKNDLEVLIENPTLDEVAQMKAEDMVKNGYFAHNSPKGKTPWHWFEKGGYDYKFAGENLAVNYFDAEEQHKAWMNSPTHRDNILNANYREVGVAVAEGVIEGMKSTITVQIFGATFATAAVSPRIEKNVSEPIGAPDAESVEAVNLGAVGAPIGIVPAARASASLSDGYLRPAKKFSIYRDNLLGIIWLVAFSLSYSSIIYNALAEAGRSYGMIYETFKKKEILQRILARYGKFLKRMRIDMQHAGSIHPARGRPG